MPVNSTAETYPEGYEWLAFASFTKPHFERQAEGDIFELIFKVGFQPNARIIFLDTAESSTYKRNPPRTTCRF